MTKVALSFLGDLTRDTFDGDKIYLGSLMECPKECLLLGRNEIYLRLRLAENKDYCTLILCAPTRPACQQISRYTV